MYNVFVFVFIIEVIIYSQLVDLKFICLYPYNNIIKKITYKFIVKIESQTLSCDAITPKKL